MFLICVFVALLYIHGENYALCKSIYPDEILDLPCSIFPFRSEAEKIICSEIRDDRQFISSVEIQISSAYRVYSEKASFHFLELTHVKDLEKRLSILQRYNS